MDENTNSATQENTAAENTVETRPTTRPTFDDMLKDGYQAEFDRRVSKAIETARGKFTDPKVKELEGRLDGYIRREAILKAGVKSDFVDFVQYTVSNNLTDGQTFETALETYLKDHVQYTNTTETAKPQAWSLPMQGTATPSEGAGVEAAFKKLNPNLKIE